MKRNSVFFGNGISFLPSSKGVPKCRGYKHISNVPPSVNDAQLGAWQPKWRHGPDLLVELLLSGINLLLAFSAHTHRCLLHPQSADAPLTDGRRFGPGSVSPFVARIPVSVRRTFSPCLSRPRRGGRSSAGCRRPLTGQLGAGDRLDTTAPSLSATG